MPAGPLPAGCPGSAPRRPGRTPWRSAPAFPRRPRAGRRPASGRPAGPGRPVPARRAAGRRTSSAGTAACSTATATAGRRRAAPPTGATYMVRAIRALSIPPTIASPIEMPNRALGLMLASACSNTRSIDRNLGVSTSRMRLLVHLLHRLLEQHVGGRLPPAALADEAVEPLGRLPAVRVPQDTKMPISRRSRRRPGTATTATVIGSMFSPGSCGVSELLRGPSAENSRKPVSIPLQDPLLEQVRRQLDALRLPAG